jgi:hypothetical protein
MSAMTVHRLLNPTPGEPSHCTCGEYFDAITTELWREHLGKQDGTKIKIQTN